MNRKENALDRARVWRTDMAKVMKESEERNYTDVEVLWTYVYDADAILSDLLGDEK